MEKVKTIEEMKTDNRIIHVSGEIDEDCAKEVVERLLFFEQKDPINDILVVVNSYGGDLHSFLAIHDAMKICRCDVATLCIGKAMSAGQLILTSGTKGKRFVSKYSRIMVHQLASGSFGKLNEMQNEIEEAENLQKILDELIISYSKINKKQLEKMLSKDTYLSSEECVKFGLADYVVNSPKDIYSRISL